LNLAVTSSLSASVIKFGQSECYYGIAYSVYHQ